MRIGIDVDGVLIDFEDHFRYKAEMYDLLELNKQGAKDKNIFWIQDKYDWTKEEANNFMQKYCVELTNNSNIIAGAGEVVNFLEKENHHLVIISARGLEGDLLCDLAKEKLDKAEINFQKYHWKIKNKLEVCQKENIEIMIDDNPKTCKMLSNAGIMTLYFRNIYGEEIEESKFLKEVNNWGEIYRFIRTIR